MSNGTETKTDDDMTLCGLRIRTVTGATFEIYGDVTHKDFDGDGRVYYCDGGSWPESIVERKLTER